MNESDKEVASQEIERLRLENSKLREDWLELSDQMLFYIGLPGHLHRIGVKTKELKASLNVSTDRALRR
jgi:hypothetical protein